jgi:hypothetical protein
MARGGAFVPGYNYRRDVMSIRPGGPESFDSDPLPSCC